VLTRPTGILLGFEISQNPFLGRPSFAAVADLPFAERIAALRDPGLRVRLLAEQCADPVLARRVSAWERIFPLTDAPDYEPAAEDSIAARAGREGRDPADLAYDLCLEDGGKALFYRPLSNYSYGNLDTVHECWRMMRRLSGWGMAGLMWGFFATPAQLARC
jgi:N-acyl-D-aspartate/D-glutamate deacylase